MYEPKPDPFSSHSQIANLIKNLNIHSVLDVGCSEGFLGKNLKDKSIYIEGIDYDRQALKVARPYYQKVYQTDLNSPKVKLFKKFDTIVLADVLEHLVNPEKTLKWSLDHLTNGGFVIISLPNIANIWVRLNLFLGRFNYTQRGILDRTHLHFYTLKTAKELLAQQGLEIVDLKVTPIPLPLISLLYAPGKIFYLVYLFLYFLTQVFKTLLAYQFIFMAQKSKLAKSR